MSPTILVLASLLACALGHGRVFQPPSRASAWRFGFPTKHNYDDDGLNCGGFSVQWSTNGGKCGICGDAYNIPEPRPHELGGVYGDGIIVAQYTPGSPITTTVQITASHLGFWEFKICPDPERNDQECFDEYVLELENGGTKYYPTRGSTTYNVNYRLPRDLVCEHCVLQWRYTAGNNWGICNNGTQGLGCGNQEQFLACSDINIGNSGTRELVGNSEENEIPNPLFNYLKNGFFDAQQGLIHLLKKRFVRPHRQDNKNDVIHIWSRPRSNQQAETLIDIELNDHEPEDTIWANIKQNVQKYFTGIKPSTSKSIQNQDTYISYDQKHPRSNASTKSKVVNNQEDRDYWTGQKLQNKKKTESFFKPKGTKYEDSKNSRWSKPKRYKPKPNKKWKQDKKSYKPKKWKKNVSYYWR